MRQRGHALQLHGRPHAHRRHVLALGGRLLHVPRSQRRHDAGRRRVGLARRGRGGPRAASQRCSRRPSSGTATTTGCSGRSPSSWPRPARPSTRRSWRSCARPSSPGSSGRGATGWSTPCRRRRPARSSASSCGRSVVTPTELLTSGAASWRSVSTAAAAGAEDRSPLVFLHEGLGSIDLWRTFPDDVRHEARLADDGRLLAARPRARVRWSTSRARSTTCTTKPTPCCPDLLDRLGIERPVLIGHSDGASIALLYAGAGRPVAGLVLLAPHVFVEDRSIAGIAAARDAYRARRSRRPHGAATTATPSRRSAAGTTSGCRRTSAAGTSRTACRRSTAPILLIQGADDQYGSVAQLDAIERGVRGPCRRVVVPGVGHSPHLEAPAATRQAVVEFIGELRDSRNRWVSRTVRPRTCAGRGRHRSR